MNRILKFVPKQLLLAALFLPLLFVARVEGQSGMLLLSPGFKNDPIKIQGVAGGKVSLAQLSGGVDSKCRGFAQGQPSHTLSLPENLMLDLLVFSPEVKSDTTMLIKGSNGLVICADDEYQGRHPHVSLRRFAKGTYQVWIGSGDGQKTPNYSLSLSEFMQK